MCYILGYLQIMGNNQILRVRLSAFGRSTDPHLYEDSTIVVGVKHENIAATAGITPHPKRLGLHALTVTFGRAPIDSDVCIASVVKKAIAAAGERHRERTFDASATLASRSILRAAELIKCAQDNLWALHKKEATTEHWREDVEAKVSWYLSRDGIFRDRLAAEKPLFRRLEMPRWTIAGEGDKSSSNDYGFVGYFAGIGKSLAISL